MVLIGQPPSAQSLYDVTDPLHPRLLCRISNSSAHLLTGDTIAYLRTGASGTNVVLHSLGSGNETITATIPRTGLESQTTAWVPDGTLAASMVPPVGAAANIQVWLFSPAYTGTLLEFPAPQLGCICRFGIPNPTVAFSADRNFLVAGWPLGPHGTPLAVYRLSDHALVKVFDSGAGFAMWDRTGHRLFVSGSAGVQSWTPEGGSVTLSGGKNWQYLPGLSPDGSEVSYTGYIDPLNQASGTLRVYVYGVSSNVTRMLVDQSRSQVLFVKDGWVWYLDEPACDPSQGGCGLWGSTLSGKVFAMSLATGVEQGVTFASGEEPSISQGYDYSFNPGEFWPSS